jgi:hypothetical protein
LEVVRDKPGCFSSGFLVRAGVSDKIGAEFLTPTASSGRDKMQEPRLSKIATRVILLQTNPAGDVTPVTIFKESRKKKKSTPGLRGAEMVAKRMADALKASATTFASRFRKSRRRKRDGWLRDMGSNALKALDSGRKELGLNRLPGT